MVGNAADCRRSSQGALVDPAGFLATDTRFLEDILKRFGFELG
jgi:hypothetical protein